MRTADAAALAAVSEATIRSWKARGLLPAEPTAVDVWRCRADRLPRTEHDRLDALWADLAADTPPSVGSGVDAAAPPVVPVQRRPTHPHPPTRDPHRQP